MYKNEKIYYLALKLVKSHILDGRGIVIVLKSYKHLPFQNMLDTQTRTKNRDMIRCSQEVRSKHRLPVIKHPSYL